MSNILAASETAYLQDEVALVEQFVTDMQKLIDCCDANKKPQLMAKYEEELAYWQEYLEERQAMLAKLTVRE